MLHEWDVFQNAFIALFGITSSRIINRDLKIRGRDKLRRLPEVNLHKKDIASLFKEFSVLTDWLFAFAFCEK